MQRDQKMFERQVGPEHVTIRSWLCSTQVDNSLVGNLWLIVNRLEFGLINLILGSI